MNHYQRVSGQLLFNNTNPPLQSSAGFVLNKMVCWRVCLFIAIFVVSANGTWKKQNTPPHCTQVTKDTDYISKYKYDYPVGYIPPGQHEAYQQLYCVNPPMVNKALTTVCDWAAPPQVQFTLGDEYMHVVRQDPTGRFFGNAVITTYQFCSHNNSTVGVNDSEPDVVVTKIDN